MMNSSALGSSFDSFYSLLSQCMINDNVLPRLVNLLTNDHVMRIKEYACRVIWHITFRSKLLKEAVVASGAISALINLLQNPEFDAKKKAAWAIRNVTYEASKDRIKFLVDEGCVSTLCNLLDSRDQETLKVCLQGLESILKAGEYEKNLESSGDDNVYAHKFKEAEGVRMMRKLLNDDGDEIHQMAARILERYFFKKKRMMSLVPWQQACTYEVLEVEEMEELFLILSLPSLFLVVLVLGLCSIAGRRSRRASVQLYCFRRS
ncbi:Importin subunit alpha-1-like protein [Drosera capensis]